MILTIALFSAVFSSIIWLAYSIRYITDSLGDMSFFDAGLLNVLLYTLFVCLPEFVIWMIFGFFSQHINGRTISRQMFKLFAQMKKNQEYSDLLARIMLETGENIRNSFMMNNFDVLIGDMNELLCEILQRDNLITYEEAGQLWTKVQNGGKWAFGKVVIERYNNFPEFKNDLSKDAKIDNVLAGSIMEFCARYQSLISLLEKYDKEKTFLNVIETGVFGKVFSVMASISDDLRRVREPGASKEFEEFSANKNNKKDTFTKTTSILSRFAYRKKDLPKIRSDKKDDFSKALERSFSDEPMIEEPKKEIKEEHKEPVFMDDFDGKKEPMSENIPDSQKVLNDLKKQWNEIEQKQTEEDALAYPFGGWTDAEKYQK